MVYPYATGVVSTALYVVSTYSSWVSFIAPSSLTPTSHHSGSACRSGLRNR